jgi:hypothetical protein
MSSISISRAKEVYGGSTERETITNMARKTGCYRIYKYANEFGNKVTHTDYKRISSESDEKALLSSDWVHNVVLVYDRGNVLNLDEVVTTPKEEPMITKPITPKWYLAKSGAKHVHQMVITLPPQSEVPSRVTSLLAGADIMMANWAVTSVFMTEATPEAKGPFVFAKASGVVEMLKGYPASVAFAFYRLNYGGVFQLFVQVDSSKVRAKAGYPYLAEHSRWLDEEADRRIVEALISRDKLEVCFVAPGANGPCTGFFGLQVDLPEIVRNVLKQEWADLLAYHKGLTNRNYQAALDQYNRENPMEGTPILPLQLKSQRFEGKTVEEAKAAVALSGIPQEQIHDLEVTRNVQDATVEGEGKSIEAAIEAARTRVPSQAFDVSSAEIIQQGQEGIVEIQAQTETEARERWKIQTPQAAALETFKCEVQPKDGFLGIGKKQGLWKAYWSKPFKARISYKVPAQVTVKYMEWRS